MKDLFEEDTSSIEELLTEDQEVEQLWDLAMPKSLGWQQSNSAVVRGDKGDLRRAWKLARKRTSVAIVALALEAQARFRKESRTTGDNIPQPKLIGPWLRAERWSDEIESHAELKERLNRKICSLKECDRYAMGERFDVCIDHYADKYCDFTDNINFLKKNNLFKLKTESPQQWRDRCRAYLDKAGFSKWLKNATSVVKQSSQN